MPVRVSPGGGPANPIAGNRDACWSEPCDLSDGKISSEIIGAFGLESELANDFVIDMDTTINRAIGYGGYYNWAPGDPPITSLNWKFYDDANCVPDELLDVFVGLGEESFIGYDGYGYPTYRYEMDLAYEVLGGQRYWFCLQAGDHAFPPQWGRQGTGYPVIGCETMFKSEFFGYPDWTEAGGLDIFYEAAQDLECGAPVAVRATSWGGIKGLYR